MKTLKDFHDLQCHVLLLADVFEIFRNINLKYHWIYSRDYLSASLSWDAMLKMTKIKLELITDLGMRMFFGKGTRGGISYISNRYNKANHKYLKSYDPKQESKHIINLDTSYGLNFFQQVDSNS